MYGYGLIGNCQSSALVGEDGSVDWLCWPRPDSEPIFGKLLDPAGGAFGVEIPDRKSGLQYYIANTNVLCTEIQIDDSTRIKITDFFPRFEQFGRIFYPLNMIRIVEPMMGQPNIKVVIDVIDGWNKKNIESARGNSHIKFNVRGTDVRLYTTMPMTYLIERTSFNLTDPIYFILTWDQVIEDDLKKISEDFLSQTLKYWERWVKRCKIPTLYQKEVIRSALCLKLHCYEDTGAILASTTTSLPEAFGGVRNWDYRHCWLRDSYYVLSAFYNLGHFEEMESFLKFLLGITDTSLTQRGRLSPVYMLDQGLPLPEREHPNWSGFQKSRPVRDNNQAAEQIQNDVYGEMILTLLPIYLDERFYHLRTPVYEKLLIQLTEAIVGCIGVEDVGLWEFRSKAQVNSFTQLMHWVGLKKIMAIKERGFLPDLKIDLKPALYKVESVLNSCVVDQIFVNGPADPSFDASLLQLPILKFPNSEINKKTVEAVAFGLGFGTAEEGFLLRYKKKDDFGVPDSAFIICSFWHIQALCRLGEFEKARGLMESVLRCQNHLGLISEHFDPVKNIQLGNFPQGYSHVGLINAAFELSPSWPHFV